MAGMSRGPRRRALLRGVVAAAAPLALPAGAGLLPSRRAAAALPAPVRFRIMREGSAIGTHRVTFADAPEGGLSATTEVDIAVRLAGFTVFRLTHRFQEVWAGQRLRLAVSRQERNGRVTEMTARADAQGLAVQGTQGALRLPAEAAPLTWWDVARIEARRPLFDNDTGRPLQLAWTRAPLPGGGRRWRCTGEEESEGAWAADGTWLSWTTKAEDGSTVTYERVA